MGLLIISCSLSGIPGKIEGCNIRTYIDGGLKDYLSTRNSSAQIPRFAIIPFEVPANFTRPGANSERFGHELARMFTRELLRQGDLGIVELFDRENWPGKRAEFFTGNYHAIEIARSAGYDFVIVGYLENIVNESDISVLTRVIDTSNSMTLWYAQSTVSSNERMLRRTYSNMTKGFLVRDQPDSFAFPERLNILVSCSVAGILSDKLPMQDTAPRDVDSYKPKMQMPW